MDHWSDNFTAEMVLKTIGYKTLGQGTTAAGAAVTTRDLAAAGIPWRASGSPTARGSRATTASPRASSTALLVKMWNDPAMRESSGRRCRSPA